MKNTLILSAAVLAFSALSSIAQTAAPAAPAVTATPAAKEMAEAEVRKVDKEAKKVTLKHGPIKNLDMPSMTMVFQVRDEKLFDKLTAGEKIKFSAEQLQGAFVVTGVEKGRYQMNDLLPCPLALTYSLLAGVVGYWLGRWREQLHLLQMLKPEN